MKAKILIVDDEHLICKLLTRVLISEGYEVNATTDPEEGLSFLKKQVFDVMVTDLRMGKMDGLDLLVRARKIQPECDVVVMTGFATVETARSALTQGASDFITKPIDIENELKPLLASLISAEAGAKQGLTKASAEVLASDEIDFVGGGDVSSRLLKRVLKVSRANIPVLLQGESGTGKERVASLLHTESSRRNSPFIKLNCAALPDTLLESELFGHARGAFTGATSDRDGLFQAADGGTLLLDEIGEISRGFQAKLLRVLQEGEFHRLGDAKKTVRVDVRVVAATNRDLIQAVRSGDFREDLYYRLNVVPIDIPPLRERAEDIPELIAHFTEKAASRHESQEKLSFSPALIQLLSDYPWPGNIRELENAIESATVLAESEVVELSDLPVAVQEFARAQGVRAPEVGISGAHSGEPTLEDIEMKCILQAMSKTGFNRTRAANLLGVTRRTLSYRIGKYGLDDALEQLQSGENLEALDVPPVVPEGQPRERISA